MKINLEQIFKELQVWRDERGITAESQKEGFLVNVIEKLGELATAVRKYNEFSKQGGVEKQKAEHEIINALCGISIFIVNTEFTINSGLINKISSFDTDKYEPSDFTDLHALLYYISQYPIKWEYIYFKEILELIAKILEVDYGFNFEVAMLETIKEISSRTGSYDENARKWVKDTSYEARKKWYKANYELSRY